METYKKIVAILASLAFLVPGIAYAIPSSVDRVVDHIEPLIKTDYIRGQYFIATSTTATSTFANGLNLTSGCFAYGGACISTGGATSPGGLNLQVQYNNAGVFGGISGAVTNGTILNLTNPLLGGATLTTSVVNGVTLTTAGSATTYLNGAGNYTVPVGTIYTGTYPINVSGSVISLQGMATTTATCTGSASCSPFTVIGLTPVTISASSAGSGFNFATTFATTAAATTSSIWLQGGAFYSSSTAASQFPYASTTYLTATNIWGTSNGGSITIDTLDALTSGTSGGSLTLNAGNGVGTGVGGAVSLIAGDGGASGSNGGQVTILAGRGRGSEIGTVGGDLILGAGDGTGGSGQGDIYFRNPTSIANFLIYNLDGITGGSKTRTEPNENGTYALGIGSAGNCANWSTTNTLTTTGAPCASGTVTAVTATYPIVSSGGATPNLTFQGLSTTTPWTTGQLAYVVNGNTVASAPTTTATCTGTASCSAFTVVGNTPVTITGAGGGGSAYPFPLTGNATSTLTQFNGGLTSYGTTTIGAGGATTGLTISGGATTTGTHKILGVLSLPGGAFQQTGSSVFTATNIATAFSTSAFNVDSPLSTFTGTNVRFGIATSTPGTPLGVNGDAVIAGIVTAQQYVATSTLAASIFPYASTTALSVSGLTPGNCVQAGTGGLLTTIGSPCGAGGVTSVTGTYPVVSSGGTTPAISLAFGTTTANTWALAQTFTNSPVFSTVGAGTVNSTVAGTIYNTATSTPTVTAPVTYSGTLGQFIGGVSGAFGCTNASAGVTGCLTGTDYNTFAAKQPAGNYITALTGDVTATGPNSVAATLATVNSNVGTFTNSTITVNGKGLITAASSGTTPEVPLTFTWPLIRTTNTVTFGGLSTSTPAVIGNIPYFTGVNTFGNVATTSATCTGSASCTPFTVIGSSPVTISATGGATGLATTSPWTGSGVAYRVSEAAVSTAATGTVTSGAGISVTAGQSIIGTGLAITNTGVISASCSGGTTCSGTNPLAINSFSYPFPSNATTTLLTVGGLTVSNLGSGTVNSTSAGVLYNTATSTPTVTAPITYSGTLGQFIGGVSGTFACNTATGAQAGCVSSTDWTTFNNKISSTSLSGTAPITYNSTTGAIGCVTCITAVTEKWATSTLPTTGIYPNTANLVGIGTTTPRYNLQLSSSTAPQLALTNGTFEGYAWRAQNGVLTLATTSPTTFATGTVSSIFNITTAGRASIGLGAPSAPMATLQLYEQNGTGASPSILLGGNAGGDTDYWLSRNTDNDGVDDDMFQIGSTTVPGTNIGFVMDRDGKIGIGTTTPYGLLALNAPGGTAPYFVIGSSTEVFKVQPSTATRLGVATTSPWRTLSVVGSAAINGLTSATGLTVNGLCIVAATKEIVENSVATCVTSSERWKHDIQSLSLGTDALMAFRPVEFARNDDNRKEIGLIAEEVAKIDPRLVGFDKEGKPDSLETTGILSIVIKAVQNLVFKTDATNERLKVLEARIEALETENAQLHANGN